MKTRIERIADSYVRIAEENNLADKKACFIGISTSLFREGMHLPESKIKGTLIRVSTSQQVKDFIMSVMGAHQDKYALCATLFCIYEKERTVKILSSIQIK